MNDFEFDRRFFCREIPQDLQNADTPTLIVQSYYVDADNYALRVRVQSRTTRLPMDEHTDAATVLDQHRDDFTAASVTVKGPSVGGTRYEAERDIDPGIAAELIKRGGTDIIKNRYEAWIGEDGWNIDVFGGANAPLIIAEAKRSQPVTNLIIPDFCITEITDQARFSNDGLATRPFSQWQSEFEQELTSNGAHFEQIYGTNRHEH
jgi:adenylate cyclase